MNHRCSAPRAVQVRFGELEFTRLAERDAQLLRPGQGYVQHAVLFLEFLQPACENSSFPLGDEVTRRKRPRPAYHDLEPDVPGFTGGLPVALSLLA